MFLDDNRNMAFIFPILVYGVQLKFVAAPETVLFVSVLPATKLAVLDWEILFELDNSKSLPS